LIKLIADYILCFDKENKILKNAEVLIDKKIIKIGKNLKANKEIYLGKNSCLLPAFINPHTHLEFSLNDTLLKYGDFIVWLNSVIEEREFLFFNCKSECYKNALNQMKKSGVCAFGEISSSGSDLKYLKHTNLKVVYFNEIIGTTPSAVDALYQDFLARLNESKEIEKQNANFKSAISIHSPYSVHPILMEKVIQIAKKEDLLIQAHFMESKAEREWLDKGEGEFKKFFEKHFKNAKPLIKPLEFLEKFKNTNTSFVHCVWANDEELKKIKELNASIIHCPVSNRLLNVGKLNLKKVKNLEIEYSIATDGLSSNYSLNMFKELKSALFLHNEFNPKEFAYELLQSITTKAAKALQLNNGSIEEGKDADLISITLPNEIKDLDYLALNVLLHTNEVDKLFINGEEINIR